jgi:hypothetical protein
VEISFLSLFLLCFNTTSKDYVMFQFKEEQELVQALANMPLTTNGNPMIRSSTVTLASSQTVPSGGRDGDKREGGGVSIESRHAQSVAIGGINFRWGQKAAKRLEWASQIVNLDVDDIMTNFSHYELPPSAVMISFHSLSGSNPGHLSKSRLMTTDGYSITIIFASIERYSMAHT